jgi:hypothetical protein
MSGVLSRECSTTQFTSAYVALGLSIQAALAA